MIGLILIIILALVGPLISKHDFLEQNVDYRNLPKNSVLDKVHFYHLMVQVLMVKMYAKVGAKRKLLVWNRSTW